VGRGDYIYAAAHRGMDPAELFAALLLEPAESPEWMEEAACKGSHPGISWFPERGSTPREPLEICAECPVRQNCLDYAMADETLVGIWGGTTSGERKRMRSRQRPAT
jgi:hypothetical protein